MDTPTFSYKSFQNYMASVTIVLRSCTEHMFRLLFFFRWSCVYKIMWNGGAQWRRLNDVFVIANGPNDNAHKCIFSLTIVFVFCCVLRQRHTVTVLLYECCCCVRLMRTRVAIKLGDFNGNIMRDTKYANCKKCYALGTLWVIWALTILLYVHTLVKLVQMI